MRVRPGRECERHAEALLDFVEGRPTRPDTAAALRHLERCPVCERETASMALVVTGLRRLGAAGREVDPPTDGWARVQRRISLPAAARPGSWRAVLRRRLAPLGLATSVPVLLAALLVAPTLSSLPGGAVSTGDAGPSVADLGVSFGASAPVVVGDSLAVGGDHAIAWGNPSELDNGSLAPAVTPGPRPVLGTEPPQPALPSAPSRSTGVGPM